MLKKILLFLYIFSTLPLFSQVKVIPDSVNTEYGFEITKWKYKSGDDLQWGLPFFNDSEWQTVHIDDFDSVFTGIGWFRSEIIFDSSFTGDRKSTRLNSSHQ